MPAGRPPLPPGPFLVVGLARSGVAVGRVLAARGETVIGVDSAPVGAGVREELEEAGVEVRAPAGGAELLAGVRTVVKSPGVPQAAPVVRAARERGRAVLGELEIAWRLLPNPFIAITGSNGKTTVTELVGHVHREAGVPVAVAGNVGTALSSLAGSVSPEAVVVCECSSFQLEDTEAFAPDVAVLLNVAEDHLDRHGTLEAYRAAKLRIFTNQGNDDIAVVPLGFESEAPGGAVADLGGCARRVTFGSGPGAELAERAGHLWWDETPLLRSDEIRLRGVHNRLNAMAAAAATLARGMPAEAVRRGLSTFPGVPHRLEEVATVRSVLYVNDSKATNVASALVGITSFPGRVHVILGGRAKGADFAPLAGPVDERCVAVYLIGEAADQLGAALAGVRVPVRRCGDLEGAVGAARAAAEPGDVVLLSPACASFDQYIDYEARGAHFRELVAG